MPQKTRFTIYDAMEQNGIFSSNPANPGSRDNDGNSLYTGPVEFPKMLYHPEGEQRIIVPAEIVVTPLGPRELNEQKEMLHLIVNNQAEADAALAEGWHDHPAKALRVRITNYIASANLTEKEEKALIAKIPAISMGANREAELMAEIARLTKLREDDAAGQKSAPAPVDMSKAPVKKPVIDDDSKEAA